MNTPDLRPTTHNTQVDTQVAEVKAILNSDANDVEAGGSSTRSERKDGILEKLNPEEITELRGLFNAFNQAKSLCDLEPLFPSGFPENFDEFLGEKGKKVFKDINQGLLDEFLTIIFIPVWKSKNNKELLEEFSNYFNVTVVDFFTLMPFPSDAGCDDLEFYFDLLRDKDLALDSLVCCEINFPAFKVGDYVKKGSVLIKTFNSSLGEEFTKRAKENKNIILNHHTPRLISKSGFILNASAKIDEFNDNKLNSISEEGSTLQQSSSMVTQYGGAEKKGEGEPMVGSEDQTGVAGDDEEKPGPAPEPAEEGIPTSKIKPDEKPESGSGDTAELDGNPNAEMIDFNKIITTILFNIYEVTRIFTTAIENDNVSSAYYAYLDLVINLFPQLNSYLENNDDLNPSIRQQIAPKIEGYEREKNHYLGLLRRLFNVLKQKKVEPWFENKLLDQKTNLETKLSQKWFWNSGKGELKSQISILTENLSEVKQLREQYPEIFFFIFDLESSNYSGDFAQRINQLRQNINEQLGDNFNLKLTNRSDVSRLRGVLSQVSKTEFYQSIKDDLSEAMTLLQGPSVSEEETSESQTLTLENLTLEQCQKLAEHPDFVSNMNDLLKDEKLPLIDLGVDGKISSQDQEYLTTLLSQFSEDFLKGIFKELFEKGYIEDWENYVK